MPYFGLDMHTATVHDMMKGLLDKAAAGKHSMLIKRSARARLLKHDGAEYLGRASSPFCPVKIVSVIGRVPISASRECPGVATNSVADAE